MNRLRPILLTALLAALLAAWLPSAQARADGPEVFASIPPLKYLAQQVAGPLARVHTLVRPGDDAHTYEPRPSQMAALARARLFFAVGMEFERAWLPRVTASNPGLTVVRVDQGIEKIPMAAHHHHEGEHEEAHGHAEAHEHHAGEGEHHGEAEHHEHAVEHHAEAHEHQGDDPHVWLSPSLAKAMARTMAQALAQVDPGNAPAYRANLEAFLAHADELDREIQAILASIPAERRTFLVFHPSWGYFARDYGLTQAPLEIQGKEPSPRELAELVEHAREHGYKVVFAQPQFSDKSARTLARELGGVVARLDPLAEDWDANLLAVAKALAQALK